MRRPVLASLVVVMCGFTVYAQQTPSRESAVAKCESFTVPGGDKALRKGVEYVGLGTDGKQHYFVVGTGTESRSVSMVAEGIGRVFFTGGPGEVLLYVPGEKKPARVFKGFGREVNATAFSSDGGRCCVLTGLSKPELFIVDVVTGRAGRGHRVDLRIDVGHQLGFLPGAKSWVLAYPDDQAKTAICSWRPDQAPEALLSIPGSGRYVYWETAQSSNQNYFVAYYREIGTPSGTMVVMDCTKPAPEAIGRWKVQLPDYNCWLAISNNGKNVAVVPFRGDHTKGGGELRVLDAQSGVLRQHIRHEGVGRIDFSPGSDLIATAAPQATRILFFAVSTGKLVRAVQFRSTTIANGYIDTVQGLVFSPKNDWLLCATACGGLHLFPCSLPPGN